MVETVRDLLRGIDRPAPAAKPSDQVIPQHFPLLAEFRAAEARRRAIYAQGRDHAEAVALLIAAGERVMGTP